MLTPVLTATQSGNLKKMVTDAARRAAIQGNFKKPLILRILDTQALKVEALFEDRDPEVNELRVENCYDINRLPIEAVFRLRVFLREAMQQKLRRVA